MSGAIAAQSPVNSEENILRQVLGFRAIACEPVADVRPANYGTQTASEMFPLNPGQTLDRAEGHLTQGDGPTQENQWVKGGEKMGRLPD